MKRVAFAPVVVAAAFLATACSAPDRTPQIPGPSPAPPAAASTSTTCPNPLASYPPSSVYSPGRMPSGTLMAQIQQRGRLVVGVSSDTRLLGARNLTNNQFEGFDIEMARQVAQAIFGDANKVQFKAISAAQRIPLVNTGAGTADQTKPGVDLVARAMTVNCDRWRQAAFSGVYFQSSLRLLVNTNRYPNSSLPALAAAKARVCATSPSTTLDKVRSFKGIQAVGVSLTTDCMVLWQQGKVNAIAADDAILAGLAQQDPSAMITGASDVEQEPYGLAIATKQPTFVQFVNAVLDRARKDGSWERAYKASGLSAVLGARTPPKPDYSRPLP
jgi:polar amino acid transport system substrate-binding protein